MSVLDDPTFGVAWAVGVDYEPGSVVPGGRTGHDTGSAFGVGAGFFGGVGDDQHRGVRSDEAGDGSDERSDGGSVRRCAIARRIGPGR